MNKEELIQFLKDNLSIEVNFRARSYRANNNLEIIIKLGKEDICRDSTTIKPTEDKDW
jgi:hypothetical protein